MLNGADLCLSSHVSRALGIYAMMLQPSVVRAFSSSRLSLNPNGYHDIKSSTAPRRIQREVDAITMSPNLTKQTLTMIPAFVASSPLKVVHFFIQMLRLRQAGKIWLFCSEDRYFEYYYAIERNRGVFVAADPIARLE